jgi:double-stranded uracil-DNA glycosylase
MNEMAEHSVRTTKRPRGQKQAQEAIERTAPLSELPAEDLDVLFCGINPALSATQAGHHFSSHSSQFWRVLHLAGFTPHPLRPDEDHKILLYGYGLTAVVKRPTVRAAELATHEFLAAAKEFERTVHHFHPRFLAFLGKSAFAALSNSASIRWGRQHVKFGGVEVWVLPNPSGLNRTFSLQALVNAYHDLRVAVEETKRQTV